MIKVATSLLDTASKWLDKNPAAATGLLTGGLGALGGFALTGSRADESTGDALKRRLKNALIVGGLAGGAGALGSTALSNFGTSHEAPLPPPVPTRTSKARKIGLDILGAGLGGYGGWALGDKVFLNTNLPGIGKKDKIGGMFLNLFPNSKVSSPGVQLNGLTKFFNTVKTLDEANRVAGGASGEEAAKLLKEIGITKIPGVKGIADKMGWLPSWLNVRNVVRGTSALGGMVAGGIGAHKLQDYLFDK